MTLDSGIPFPGEEPLGENLSNDEAAPGGERKEAGAEDLARFLARLDPDSPHGGENYKQLKRGLAKFFECNGCSDTDVHVSEVVHRAAAKLGSEDIRDLVPYCFAIAKYIAKEAQKQQRRVGSLEDFSEEKRDLADPRDYEIEIVEGIDRKRLVDCVRRCIAKLRPDDQKLVIQFYDTYQGEKIGWRRKLAERYGIEMGALRTRMTRLREKLEPLVRQCVGTH